MVIDLTPAEETQIYRLASKMGVPPAEYARRIVTTHLPSTDVSETPTPDAENARAIAQLQAWMDEEATDDAEEIRLATANLDELLKNLNRNRIESGESPLFS